tara:strand:+ start:1899 stop:2456 length:558 start_codon:yes stop_codon:yes gene_type:complete
MHKKVNIALLVIAILSGFWFVNGIYTRIDFEEQFDYRKKVVIERLLDYKNFQLAYKDAHGIFAKDIDTLLNFVKYDTFNVNIVTQTGFDSLNEPILDTSYVYMAVRDSLAPKGYTLDQAAVIPFSENKSFDVQAGQIQKGRVKVEVFKVSAPFAAFLHDQDDNLYDKADEWSIGSLTEPTYGGNW